MKVDIDGRPFEAWWLHGTYNSTLWMSMDEDGVEVFDLYYEKDRKVLEIDSSPEIVMVEGDLEIHFYHGRQRVDEDLDDWGSDGPSVKVSKVMLDRQAVSFTDATGGRYLSYVGDLLLYHGVYYGDITVSEAGK